MYARYVLRSMRAETRAATLAAAAEEFWPKLREAPGFRKFLLVQTDDGQTLGIAVWESEEQARAFEPIAAAWQHRLDGFGHTLQARGEGTVTEI
ncbi:MAG: hypothetical protein RMK01_05420 [Thermomicrobium sp.]|nr:hypothetical protein [Thermomicrobium sp.]MDW8059494.1 hypothetical protein [Thermomicrobium sp.]